MSITDPIAAVLGPHGLLSRSNPTYEHRPQQLAVASAVRKAYQERAIALIEAGTGTGKTLAYLLPAAISGRRTVVSTATKTLQEQILTKDLPQLGAAVDLTLTATVMKGRANYLCLLRFHEVSNDPRVVFPTKAEARAFGEVAAWAERTDFGDCSELALPEGLELWKRLTATSETCAGSQCDHFEECFVTRMRRRAAESDLIIVNHHLFFADLALKTSGGGGGGAEVIPSYEAVIFDEAHAIEDVATEFFGLRASDYRILDWVHDAERLLGGSTSLARIEPLSRHFFSRVAALVPPGRDGMRRFGSREAHPLKGDALELREALQGLKGWLSSNESTEAAALTRRVETLASDLKFLTAAEEPGFVYWAERRARSVLLRAAPIEVAEELASRLYRSTDTIVFTSATLATQGRLDFMKRRLGLADPETGADRFRVEELVSDSPFDYGTQALLYTPTHLPEPIDPRFNDAVADELMALCEVTGGRAFALFTSLKAMTLAHAALKDRLPYRVLLQGERPKSALLADFREKPSVLFAAQSFWEGVDVPGDALSLVVIDKLPFAPPDDPVTAARIDGMRERGEEPFSSYQVPRAALALRQGFGRLIRSRRDRGIVAVLDRRIVTKGYGKAFLQSLPEAPRVATREQVEVWWRGGSPP